MPARSSYKSKSKAEKRGKGKVTSKARAFFFTFLCFCTSLGSIQGAFAVKRAGLTNPVRAWATHTFGLQSTNLRLVERVTAGWALLHLRRDWRGGLFSGRGGPAFLASAGVNIDDFLSRLGPRVVAKSTRRIVPGRRALREHLSQAPKLPDQLAPTQESSTGRGVIATHPETQSKEDCQRQDDFGRVHRLSLEQNRWIVAVNVTLKGQQHLEPRVHVTLHASTHV
jgi:hypothetical protein